MPNVGWASARPLGRGGRDRDSGYDPILLAMEPAGLAGSTGSALPYGIRAASRTHLSRLRIRAALIAFAFEFRPACVFGERNETYRAVSARSTQFRFREATIPRLGLADWIIRHDLIWCPHDSNRHFGAGKSLPEGTICPGDDSRIIGR